MLTIWNVLFVAYAYVYKMHINYVYLYTVHVVSSIVCARLYLIQHQVGGFHVPANIWGTKLIGGVRRQM